MKKPKLTPWFDAKKDNPVRNGWYEVRCQARSSRFNYSDLSMTDGRVPGMRFWKSGAWRFQPGFKKTSNVGQISYLKDEWRGLTSKAAA